MNDSAKLAAIRERIDRVDDELVPLLVRRIALALDASNYKRSEAEVRGCDRVREVLDAAAARARAVGGDEDTVVAIYGFIVEKLTALQLRRKGLVES